MTTARSTGASGPPPPTIRKCIAATTRIVVLFSQHPAPDVVARKGNYSIADVNNLESALEPTVVEYDEESALAVLFAPPPVAGSPGSWIRITYSMHGTEQVAFTRVLSEFGFVAATLEEGRAFDGATENLTPTSARSRFTLPGISALTVVVGGLIALVVLGVIAMRSASSSDMGTIASAAFGVIGSITGAFFGIHTGLGNREDLERDRHAEATKGQMLAAMIPESSQPAAREVITMIESSVRR